MKIYDLLIVGGGSAGMAAAIRAKENGLNDVAVIERTERAGGILSQCIHDGFGIYEFEKQMTGPEYAGAMLEKLDKSGAELLTETIALGLRFCDEGFKAIVASPAFGRKEIFARSIILATGCRERTREELRIPGTRPAGVFTAGEVQYMMNIMNLLPGKSAVIVGTGDIGLIMARRMTWEGIPVKMVLGLEASGLMRNYVQCIRDYNIPIKFGWTAVSISGRKHVKGITIAPVGDDGKPIIAQKQYIPCDMVVIAAGLIPEMKLWRGLFFSRKMRPEPVKSPDEVTTQIPGIFICGNAMRVYDTADEVSACGRMAADAASKYLSGDASPVKKEFSGSKQPKHKITEEDKKFISSADENSKNMLCCIRCPKGCLLKIDEGGNITGNSCKEGPKWAEDELSHPVRTVTTTLAIEGDEDHLLPVRSSNPVPKENILEILKFCRRTRVSAPVKAGDIILKDILKDGTDVSIISCADLNG